MRLEHYHDGDMLYIGLRDMVSTESSEVAPGIVLDFGEDGEVVGIEIDQAARRFDVRNLRIEALPIFERRKAA